MSSVNVLGVQGRVLVDVLDCVRLGASRPPFIYQKNSKFISACRPTGHASGLLEDKVCRSYITSARRN